MTNKMDSELNSGLMEPSTVVSIKMAKSMAKESSYGPMRAPTMVTFTIMRCMGGASSAGQMAENITEIGYKAWWKEQASSNFQTARDIKVNTEKIRNTDMGYLSGPVAKSTADTGCMESNMAEANSSRTGWRDKESGTTASTRNGSQIK